MSQAFRGERLHIAVLGRCNTGKSTVLNLIAGQRAAIVSPSPGTTGDPVPLAFELLPLGPVTLYDTAGLNEDSELGLLRREAGRKVLARADMAVVVTDEKGIGPWEEDIMASLRTLETPFALIFNKKDLGPPPERDLHRCEAEGIYSVCLSADRERDPAPLREMLLHLAPAADARPDVIVGLLPPGGLVICVTPIDASAPKGRLIAPQVQVLRELVEHHHPALVVQHGELPRSLALLREAPAFVVTDSQVAREVAAAVPANVPVTTFSLLFARLKGDFAQLMAGTLAAESLPEGARVLVAEACSHHPQEDDIARVKIPALLRKRLERELEFVFCAGRDFPDGIGAFDLVAHCGGCMLNPGEMRRRLRIAALAGVPVSNFGMLISLAQGVLERMAAPLLPGGR